MYRVVALLLSVTAITCFTPWLLAQAPPVPQESPATFEDTFNLLPDLDVAPGGDLFESRVQFTGMYEVEQGTRQGKLSIQAVLQPGWHIYSTTQPSGGPLRTEIDVTTSPEFRLVGDFEADRDPHVISDPVFPGVEIEEFPREVTWSATILLSEDIDPESLQIQVVINGQVCETGGSCELITNERVEMKFAGYFRPPTATGSYQDENGHITIVGHVQPRVAAPGDTLQLVLTARLESPWHVYRQAPTDPKEIAKPTLIVLRKTAGWDYGVPESSVKPKEEATDLPDVPFLYYHEGTVSWTIPITVPKDADVGEYEIAGGIAYQTCTSQACDLPTAADFQAKVAVGKGSVQGELPLTFTASTYDKLAKEAAASAETKKPTPVTAGESKLDRMPLYMVLAIAFLAGLILNVMPCVLPVIGLKVMSFIHQAGGSRGEILALNIWFSLGLMAVFWVLAAAAAFAGHQWAEHFGDMRFLITMIGIVFAFGLSFLGVWEIPIPGFVGSSSMQGAAEKEGAVGAFSKGVLSTILATPCAGPMLGPAVGWAVKQPTGLTFTAFTMIGLGMATPYLLVGVAPRLVSFLPKPGAWMDTFKQVMGFVLMATVIFLFLSVPYEYVIPTLTLLLGIGVGCWLIGKTPMTADLSTRVKGWAGCLAVIALSAVLGFVVLMPSYKIDWQPFSRISLDQHLKEGHTVLVDFTANW